MTQPLIALLTDFGTSDPYVGVMKGVMASRCPDAQFIDITHEVDPQNIQQGAYLLRSAYQYFPSYTVFLVVVDPGVGTLRRPLAIKTDHGLYVGPDNGVFSGVLDEADSWQAVVLWPPEHISATFHGRDLFAPAAADLASGRSLNEIGSPIVDIARPALLRTDHVARDILEGEVIHIDHFGNIITSLGHFDWRNEGRNLLLERKPEISFEALATQVMVGDTQIIGIQGTYGFTPPGTLLALINSDRQLEIAVNQGSAASLTGVQLGDRVRIRFKLRSGE
ncbi:MAG: SAM-dependent chlorinase/fluorinase [Chloroflexota bacterium]